MACEGLRNRSWRSWRALSSPPAPLDSQPQPLNASRSTRSRQQDEEVDVLLCGPGLVGIFCLKCAQPNTSEASGRLYYSPANETAVATCRPCRSTLGITAGILLGALLALLICWRAATWFYAHRVSEGRKKQLGMIR